MLVPKSDFIGLEGVAHLAAGGETPFLRQHLDAAAQFAADKACGLAGRRRFEEVRERARAALAELLSLEPGDIALLGSSSQGIAQVASSIDWQPGDSAAASEIEFPSGRFQLARLRALGVELRTPRDVGGYLPADAIAEACDERTRLVYLSHVSFLTGQRLDLADVAERVRRRAPRALVLADATHALGVVPVPGDSCDFVVCSGYKWLLASHMGVLAWNRRRQPDFRPLGVGWRSGDHAPDPDVYALHADATRAEQGNPNFLDVYVLESALRYLRAVGVERIATHALELGGELLGALAELGLPVTTPAAAGERAGNICFAHPRAERIAELAAERGIQIWGGDGRVRLSVHLYTTREDVGRLLGALPELLAGAA